VKPPLSGAPTSVWASPGWVGEILRALETAQLEGEVTTREDATTWVRSRFG
jgi:hypothetical protein